MEPSKGKPHSLARVARKLISFLSFILIFSFLAMPTASANSEGLKVLDISERAYDGGNALAVTFNVALDSSQNIDRFLSVSQLNGPVVDGSWILSDNQKLVYFEHIEPKTDYQVRVLPGLISMQGQRLESESSQQLKTRSILPSAVFASSGHFLPARVSDGLIVNSVNVPEVDVDFFRVKPEHTTAFLEEAQRHRGTNWYSYYLNRITSMSDLIYSGRYQLQPARNKRGNSTIALDQVSGIGDAGIYLAVMSTPGNYSDNRQVSHFTVTDLGIHTRIYDNRVDVYLSSIATGKAIENVQIDIRDKKGRIQKNGSSNKQGYVSFDYVDSSADMITATLGSHFSYLKLEGPALDLSDFELGKKSSRAEEIFVYAPRDLYRPGESIDFNALRRDSDGKSIVDIPLRVKVLRPDRVAAHDFVWHAEQPGYYQYRYPISETAKPGNWTLQVLGIGDQPVEYRFKVEEFLPERMEMEFNKGLLEPLFFDEADAIKIPVTGRYLYGAPADGNRISTWVSAKKAGNIIDGLTGYQFGHEDVSDSKPFAADDIKLDKEGNGVISLGAQWRSSKSALEVKLISSLYETGGRPVNRVYKAYIWPESAMVGIRADFGDKNPDPNGQVGFKLVKSTNDGKLLAVNDLEVTLIREDRNYFWEYNANEGWHWQWTEKEFPVYNQTINLDGNNPTALKVPVEYGRYRLEVRDRDNNNQISSYRFHAGRDWYYWWRKNNDSGVAVRPDQVNLAFDAEAYKAGDIAKLRIVSPHAGQAIITVESSGLLWFKRTQIEAQGSTIDIPVDEGWASHDIYVSAVVFKAGDSANVISPNRAIGVRHLPLDRKERQLSVEIESADKILPDQTHRFRIKVEGQGKAQNRHITLAAVDVGVLAISSFETPDPFDAFFGQRRYNVDQRDMYQKIIELEASARAKLRFGGDASLSRGGEAAKADVQIVSMFSGLVDIDANGIADVSMQIPDFNGRLRLMAMAFDDDSFGSADKEVTVAAPVVAQLSLPRFMAYNDVATLALDLTNLSGKAQQFRLDIQASHPLRLASRFDDTVDLKEGERKTIRFNVGAKEFNGQGQIKLAVTDNNGQMLNKTWKLSVRSPYPAVTESVGSVLNAGDSINIADKIDLGQYRQGSLQALVSVSTEANLRLQEQLQHLIGYPYGCLEQTASKAYPLAYASASRLQEVGIKPYSNADIQQRIDKGTSRLSSLQKSNGGFGLWDSNSLEEQWLTAYAADFMLTARDNGYQISADMLANTLTRLQQYVRHQGSFVRQRYSEGPKHYAIASKAYAAYLLSDLNKLSLAALRTLYNSEANEILTPLPMLHLGLSLRQQGDRKLGNEAIDRALDMSLRQGQYYYGDYGSVIRDLGLMVHLLIKHDVRLKKAREYGFQLAEELRRRRWLSTQERNALFLAGLALQGLPSDKWQVQIKTSHESISFKGKASQNRLLDAQTIGEELMLEASEGKGLYASMSVSGYLNQAPKPEENGLSIRRHYFNSSGKPLDMDQIRTGDLVLVDVVLGANQRTPDALLVDLLPAGFELENQNLDTAVSLNAFEINGEKISVLQKNVEVVYQEFRDDRYVAAVDLSRYRESHIIYLMRAVTPGTYAVPSPFVEDMYRPEIRAIGQTTQFVTIQNKP